MLRYPGAVPDLPLCPYCHTTLFVFGPVMGEINTPLGAVVSNNDLFLRAFARLRRRRVEVKRGDALVAAGVRIGHRDQRPGEGRCRPPG